MTSGCLEPQATKSAADDSARTDGLAQMLLWTSGVANLSAEDVREVLDGTVAAIVSNFGDLIGLWPDKTQSLL